MPINQPIRRSKENLMLAILGLAGLAACLMLYPQFERPYSFEMQIDRSEALRVSESLLFQFGVDASQFSDRNVSFFVDNRFGSFVKSSGISQDAVSNLIAYSPPAHWSILLSNSQTGEFFRLRVSPQGEIFYVQREVPQGVAGASLTQGEAQAIVMASGNRLTPLNWSAYTRVDAQVQEFASRRDHAFTWRHESDEVDGLAMMMEVHLTGDVITGWEREVEYPISFQNLFSSRLEFLNTSVSVGQIVSLFIIWILAMFVFALRFRANEVSVRNGVMIVLCFFVLFMISIVDFYPFFAGLPGASGGPRGPSILIQVGTQSFFTALGLFFVWTSGESLARDLWPAKLRTMDALFARHWFRLDLGRNVLRGYAIAGILLGAFAILGWFISRQESVWALTGNVQQQFLSAQTAAFSFVPPFYVFVNSSLAMMLAGSFALLFMLAFLKRWIKSNLVIGCISMLLFGTLFNETSIYLPYLFTSIDGIVAAGIFIYFFFRYDLFTVVLAGIISMSVPQLLFMMSQPGSTIQMQGMLGLGLIGVGLLLGFVMRFYGAQLDEQAIQPTYERFITERQRLKFELDIARQAQLKMMPRHLPQPQELDIAAYTEPAKEVGGDYFDFFELGERHLGFAVGDVSGKGISAALYMTLLKGSLQSQANAQTEPNALLSHINRTFFQTAEKNMFVTLFYGMIDLQTSQFTFARAGHNPVLIYRPSSHTVYVLQPPGLGIGLEKGEIFERTLRNESFSLQQGDTIVLYTDGLTEARNAEQEEFGQERLVELIKNAPYSSAEHLLSIIRKRVKTFSGSPDPEDDLTCMIIRVN